MGRDPWMIDLGGQVSAGGVTDEGWPVAIAHPHNRTTPHLRLTLLHGSLSTSGGSERDLTAGGTRVGHIFDPRTGRPAPFAGSVTVWHERGLAADILSTALYVMGPDEGLRWAAAHQVAALYLIPEGSAVLARMTAAFQTAPGLTLSALE
jgi:thiamine biosynthesis lipoprotein